jgi:hypothetical protein
MRQVQDKKIADGFYKAATRLCDDEEGKQER